MVDDGWEEPLILFGLIIGPSGCRKSALIKVLKKALVRFIQEKQCQHDEHAPTAYVANEITKDIAKKLKGCIIKEIQKECISDDGSFNYEKLKFWTHSHADKLTQLSNHSGLAHRPGLFIDVSTDRGLIKVLQEQGEYGLIFDTEPGWLLETTGAQRNSVELFLKAYDAEPYSYKSRHSEFILANPLINILSAAQPDIAADLYGGHTKKAANYSRCYLHQ